MSLKVHYGIYQNSRAYCYLSETGKVYTWGNNDYGGYSLHLAKDISENIVKILTGERGFCALRNDGKVFTWGTDTRDCYNIKEENANYIDIFSNDDGFGGLKNNGEQS